MYKGIPGYSDGEIADMLVEGVITTESDCTRRFRLAFEWPGDTSRQDDRLQVTEGENFILTCANLIHGTLDEGQATGVSILQKLEMCLDFRSIPPNTGCFCLT